MPAAIPRRQRIAMPLWQALAAAETPITVADLAQAIGAARPRVRTQLSIWQRASLVAASEDQPRVFTMTDHADRAAPAPVVSWATADRPRQRKPTSRQKVWSAVRVMGRFDLPNLLLVTRDACIADRVTMTFLNALQRAGYVALTRKGHRNLREPSAYRLLRNTGPRAPVISHSRQDGRTIVVLVDQNDGSRHDISPGTVSLTGGGRG